MARAPTAFCKCPSPLSAYVAPFLTLLFWVKMRPAIASYGSDLLKQLKEFKVTLEFVSVVMCLAVLVLSTFPELLIRVAYSQEFLPAGRLIPVQLLGDYFYFICFGILTFFLSISKGWTYFWGWTVYYVILMAVSLGLLGKYQIEAVPLGYLIVSASLAVVGLFLFSYKYSTHGLDFLSLAVLKNLILMGIQFFFLFYSPVPYLKYVTLAMISAYLVWSHRGRIAELL